MERASESAVTSLATSAQIDHYRILIVDDLEENLDLLEDVFHDQGYETLRARNGMEALELLLAKSVHCIIADAMMPKMDGFELCKTVRRLVAYATTPFVIHTANYVTEEDESFAKKVGVDRYIVKSPGLEALLDNVKQLLSERFGHVPEEADRHSSPAQFLDGIDDPTFLETHHTMVSKKLEEKMAELEIYAETLRRRNTELKASEARYRSLFEHVGVAIFVVDRLSGKILDVNNMGETLVRSDRENLLAMKTIPFVENDAFVSSLFQTTTYVSGESALKLSNGDVVEVEVGASPVSQHNDTRLILFIRDVTEERKMRQQLIQAEKMMMMGCFATGIAHEIRNPLTAVALNLQYLLQKHGGQTDIREYVEAAFEATQRVGNVVENTLNLARRTPLSLKPQQVNDVVNDALRFVRIPLQEKNLKVIMNLADALPFVSLDAKEVQQALLNLFQNAIEASPPGSSITIGTDMRESKWREDKQIRIGIAVKDSGRGIKTEDLPHLFEPLRTTKSGGTGIGLALSKHIMDRHGGEISLESHPQGGTTARLVFISHSGNNGGVHVKR